MSKKWPKPYSTNALEGEYFILLNNILSGLLAKFDNEFQKSSTLVYKTDGWEDDILELFKSIKLYISNFTFLSLDQLFRKIARLSRQSINNQFQQVLGINPLLNDTKLQELSDIFIKSNISYIKTISNEFFDRIEQILYRRILAGENYSTISEEIAKTFDVSLGKASVIARDQTTKYYAKLNEVRYEELGIDEYIWRTVEDERVRKDHAILDKTEQKFSKPPVTCTEGKRAGERNNPGGDILCRCWPEPKLDKIVYGTTPVSTEIRETNL